MKFGKLSDVDSVNFSLPPVPATSIEYLKNLKSNSTSKHFYIGCTGWGMKEWIGSVYPKKAKTADFLKYYSEQFNTIELNTTHYRIPTLETIQKWFDNTPDDFRFCPKIPQTISHARDLGLNGKNINLFCDNIALLDQKLGCCFMQLPPYFDISRVNLLKEFITSFSKEIPLSIEFRHESWFQNQAIFQDVLHFFRTKNISTVITDVSGRRDVLHNEFTTRKTLIRFVGNALHPTDYTRIDEWLRLFQEIVDSGVNEVYFFTHEPDNILSPQISKYLFDQVQKTLKINTRGPDLSRHQEGEQMSLF